MAPFFWGDVEKVARKAFVRLGMDRTAQRNGVLIFLVPSRKRFAVLGDEGIHAKVGQDFWDEAAACLSAHFHARSSPKAWWRGSPAGRTPGRTLPLGRRSGPQRAA